MLSFKTDDYLRAPGDIHHLAGAYSLDELKVGDHTLTFSAPIGYKFDATHVEDGVLVTGSFDARAEVPCDLCLDTATLELSPSISQLYLFSGKGASNAPDEEEDDTLELPQNHTLDLGELIEVTMVAETPFVITCKEDCKGLCPQCGANLNYETCSCSQGDDDQESSKNPFACLEDLKKSLK